MQESQVKNEPAPLEVRVELRRGVAVAVPTEPFPPVTAEDVEELRLRLREEHEDRSR